MFPDQSPAQAQSLWIRTMGKGIYPGSHCGMTLFSVDRLLNLVRPHGSFALQEAMTLHTSASRPNTEGGPEVVEPSEFSSSDGLFQFAGVKI